MKHLLKEILDEEGNSISPQLAKDVKNYLIDIDGTITEDIPNEEIERMVNCEPWLDALIIINQWFNEGHIITFFTSRTEDSRSVTINWLNKHGFKFHNLLMNKPRGGNYHWIDNHIVRATRFKSKWTNMVKKNSTIEVFDNDQDE
jgi:hypothetical protein